MTTFLATFVVAAKQSDTEAINHVVATFDFVPIAQAANLHVFLIRSDKSQAQLAALLSECLDPRDFCYLVEHPAPTAASHHLREALEWIARAPQS